MVLHIIVLYAVFFVLSHIMSSKLFARKPTPPQGSGGDSGEEMEAWQRVCSLKVILQFVAV